MWLTTILYLLATLLGLLLLSDLMMYFKFTKLFKNPRVSVQFAPRFFIVMRVTNQA